MSSRADMLITAQHALNAHHRTNSGTCAECKTSHPFPCPVWALAAQVISLVHDSIRTHPPPRVDSSEQPAHESVRHERKAFR